jgi:iron complex outermembrane receptor protein
LPSLSQVTFNIPKVDVKGFEVQVAVRPAEGLSFDFGYGLTDAQMGTFLVTNFAGPQDYSGNKVPYTPSYNLNAGGQYQMALGVGDLTATLRADYYQVGKVRWEVDNTVYSPTHGWVDARLSVDSESWSLSLWGRNLTNKRWAVSAFSQNQVGALALLGGDAVATNVGRQYGVTASARF